MLKSHNKKIFIGLLIISLAITFFIKQQMLKPVYVVSGTLTIGKIFERPLLKTKEILDNLRSYKNDPNYKEFLYDVRLGEEQELYWEGKPDYSKESNPFEKNHKKYTLHNKIIIDFRGENKELLNKKIKSLLQKVKFDHDRLYDESIELFKTMPMSPNYLKKNEQILQIDGVLGNFFCKLSRKEIEIIPKQNISDTYVFYNCYTDQRSTKPVFTFKTQFVFEIIQYYKKFRGKGPNFTNSFFRRTVYNISSPHKTGVSYIKSILLIFLFFLLCLILLVLNVKNSDVKQN